ncbi:MFS transporter [Ruminococcaceae bacterium OttesenSCG-928-N02]|nr:MFS transporter [Ruminococcaceae bacterium OttesenSCG-928-N02]
MPQSTTQQPAQKNGFHYGWVIVFCGFMIMCFVTCIVSNCVSLFVKPVSEGLGITRQAFSLTTSFYSVAGMLMSLLVSKIIARYDVKKVMMISSVLMPIIYAGYGVANNIYIYYAISFALGFLGMALTMVPISTLITRWFNEKRGLALGLALTGSGLGGVFLSPLASGWIAQYSYQRTYLILALLMFVMVVPCTFFLVKNHPEDKGLEPYGGYPTGTATKAASGMSAAQARRTPLFIMWVPVVVLVTASCSSMMQQLVSYVSDIGYDPAFAGRVGAMLMGSLAIGKILLGQLFDRLGAKRAALLSLLMLLSAFSCLLFAQNILFLYAALVFAGLGIAFSTVAYPVITQDLFGSKDYTAIYSNITLASNLGMTFGSPMTATIYDVTGSYFTAWAMYAVVAAVCIVIVSTLYKKKDKVLSAFAQTQAGSEPAQGENA